MSKRNRLKSNKGNERKHAVLSLSSYDPVVVEIPIIEVTDTMVEEEMRNTALKFPDFKHVSGRTVQEKDHVLISMTTTHEGEEVENLSYEQRRIAVSDKYIPEGLKANLINMSVGETKTIEYKADSGEFDEKGNPLFIKVSSLVILHEIQEERSPEVTDEWVKKWIPGAQTVDEFRERVTRQLEGKAHAYNEEMKYSSCTAALAQRLEGSISDDLFEQGIAAAQQSFEDFLKQSHLTREEYLQRNGLDENQLSVQFMMQGRQMIAEGIALEAMADHLELEANDDDINAVFGSDLSPLQVQNMRDAYERADKTEELIRMARCGKALEHVVSSALISRKKLTGSMNPFETA